VAFVDADDLVLPSSIDLLIRLKILQDSYSDIIYFSFYKQNKAIVLGRRCIKGNGKIKFLEECLENPTRYMTVWSKLFRTKFLRDGAIYFDDDLKFCEDSKFMLTSLLKARQITVSDVLFYRYLINENSTVHQVNSNDSRDYLRSLVKIAEYIGTNAPQLEPSFQLFAIRNLYVVCVNKLFATLLTRRSQKNILVAMCSSEPISSALKSMKLSNVKSINDLPAVLLKHKFFGMVILLFKIRWLLNYINSRVCK
jgi:hypothetical protein